MLGTWNEADRLPRDAEFVHALVERTMDGESTPIVKTAEYKKGKWYIMEEKRGVKYYEVIAWRYMEIDNG